MTTAITSMSSALVPTTVAPDNSIAVLPFADMSKGGDSEYLSDGLSEELLNVLAQIPNLHVASRTSSFAFKNANVDIPTIGAQLSVAHVLEGSVRKSNGRVRITVQLIRADSGYHIWSNSYDRELGDIFAIQEDIANAVVENLRVKLLGDPPSVPDVNPEAYSRYLLAQQSARLRTPDGYEKSNAQYREALDIEPNYAAAWNGLATNFRRQTVIGVLSFDEGYPLAREAAQQAITINPDYASAFAELARISINYEGDLQAAAGYLTRAIQLEPANAEVLGNAAVLAFNLGRVDEAISLGEHISSRDPLNPAAHSNLGLYYLYGGSLDKAIASYRAALTLSPGRTGANYEIGVAHLLKAEPERALAAFADERDDEWRVKGTAMALHDLIRQTDYESALAELINRWGQRWPSEVAQVYAWSGNADAAFQWLDKAVLQNEVGLKNQFLVPMYASLHADPRWREFRERTGSSESQLAAIEFRVGFPD